MGKPRSFARRQSKFDGVLECSSANSINKKSSLGVVPGASYLTKDEQRKKDAKYAKATQYLTEHDIATKLCGELLKGRDLMMQEYERFIFSSERSECDEEGNMSTITDYEVREMTDEEMIAAIQMNLDYWANISAKDYGTWRNNLTVRELIRNAMFDINGVVSECNQHVYFEITMSNPRPLCL